MATILADLDFRVFLQPAVGGGGNYLSYLLFGLGWTLLLSVCSWVLAFVVGSLIGVLRTLRGTLLPQLGAFYVEIFRNIPLLVQLFIWYFVLPELLPARIGMAIKQMDPPWGSFIPALICLGLFTAARIAEQVRAGLQALPRGQIQAASALGFARGGTYRLILLPQAFRIILPTLTNEFMTIFKNTSVALTIGLVELTATAADEAGAPEEGVTALRAGAASSAALLEACT